ncbi:hypothetical protein, partial [Massilia glaciei]
MTNFPPACRPRNSLFGRCWVALIVLMLSTANGHAATLQVRIPGAPPSAKGHASYFPKLLRLALEKTRATDGPFEIAYFKHPLSSLRQNAELKKGGAINVMWDGTNGEREAELLPVRISLLRELNDYRVFLIRAEDQEKFRAVRTLDDLRQMRAGAGVNWPSTDVLRANGLPVATSITLEFLFPMLRVKRFDYMPRGVYEAFYEQRVHASDGIVIEKSLFLHYQVPFYFFVSRDNPALADRIRRGLTIALKC